MKDRWMNIGYEENELRPYKEASKELDSRRIGNKLCFLLFTEQKMILFCGGETLASS